MYIFVRYTYIYLQQHYIYISMFSYIFTNIPFLAIIKYICYIQCKQCVTYLHMWTKK